MRFEILDWKTAVRDDACQEGGGYMSDHSEHFSDSGFWQKFKLYAGTAGRKVIKIALTLFYCAQDAATPGWARNTIYGALGYFIFPLDAIPDVVPIAGYSDDLLALALAMATVVAFIKPIHRQKAEEKLRDWSWSGDDPEDNEDASTTDKA